MHKQTRSFDSDIATSVSSEINGGSLPLPTSLRCGLGTRNIISRCSCSQQYTQMHRTSVLNTTDRLQVTATTSTEVNSSSFLQACAGLPAESIRAMSHVQLVDKVACVTQQVVQPLTVARLFLCSILCNFNSRTTLFLLHSVQPCCNEAER